ncbi:MAG: YdeI/OmpD-associated family protein [Candidatus Zixiibacteriota bacterium]
MTDQYYAKSRAAWRSWLKHHHCTKEGVWLVFYKRHTDTPCVTYAEAVEEALCFGWIDSILKRVDNEKYIQRFTPRRPGSKWSLLNKSRAHKMIAEKKMTPAGLRVLGNALDSDATTAVPLYRTVGDTGPDDLKAALKRNKTAWRNWQSFAPGYRRRYVVWIISAKRPETRSGRIAEAVSLIARNVKGLMK